jgi:hypothetical protein
MYYLKEDIQMKFNKVLVFTLAGAMLASGIVASAEYSPNKALQEPVPISSLNVNEKPQDSYEGFHFVIVINGTALNPEENKVYMKDDDTIMIPLRAVTETLGYEIQWNNEARVVELLKGPNLIMVKPGEDYYSFGKMAPVKLGTASEILKGTTYVPLNFLTDILKVETVMDETGGINITSQQTETKESTLLQTLGKISEINKTEKGTSLWIEGENSDEGYDSIVLHINEETPLIDPITDKTLSIKDLKQGDSVRAFYGPALTRSLPPQGQAERIELLKDVTVKAGVITDIMSYDKTNQILIGDKVNGIVLTISDKTKIITEDNKELAFTDLKKGMDIEAYHSLMATMSLPPISSAEKIVVKKVDTQASTEK